MKRFKKTIALVMTAAMLLSIAGCHKKIKKVDEDDVIAALEDVLDLEEADDSVYKTDYYDIMEDFPGREICIRGYVDRNAGIDIGAVITYIVYEDEDDSEKYFEDYYDAFTNNDMFEDKYSGYYNEGEMGYIVIEVGEFFNAAYYVDDMILEVSAHSEEDIEAAKKFIRELGLPLK